MFAPKSYRSVGGLDRIRHLKPVIAIFMLVLPALSVAQAKADVVWIDVRTGAEYAEGHVSGAVNIPHDVIASRIGEYGIASATPIYVYCRSGKRAEMALEALRGLGYSDVTNMGGVDQAQALWSSMQSVPAEDAEMP